MSRADTVLTEGSDLYVRIRRGMYARVDRRGRRIGGISWGFTREDGKRVRWRPARRCEYDISVDGLTCPRCGYYDSGYAETGVRSYCMKQGSHVV